MEGRRSQFVDEVLRGEGLTRSQAERVVSAAIDRWVWYAGWTDKVAQVAGNANPVAGPYFNLSAPEPTGVVAVLAPQDSSLLGLVSVLAPVLVPGNTAVVVTSESRPLPAVTLSEVLATSDVPGGVVNVITGRTAEVAPWLASHSDVNALDLTGAVGVDGLSWGDLEAAGGGDAEASAAPPVVRRPTGLQRLPARIASSPSPRPRRSGTRRAPDGVESQRPGGAPGRSTRPSPTPSSKARRRAWSVPWPGWCSCAARRAPARRR